MKLLTKDAQNKIDQQIQSLHDEVLRLQELLEGKNKALEVQAKELAGKASELSAAQAATHAAQAAANAATADKAQAAADAQAKLEAQANALAGKASALSAAQAAVTKAEQASQAAAAASKAQLEALQAQTRVEIDTLKKQAAESAKKVSDETQENELLLNQLMQVQEELETYYLGQKKFEELYQGMQSRWMRLEKRHPSYVDFRSVDVVEFDHQAEVPSVTWVVKDYAQGGAAIDEFKFQTVMQDGQPGIGLVDKDNSNASEGVLVPKLLKPQSNQLQRFVRMGQSNFRQLFAATSIIMQMERSDWRDVKLPQDFDLGFWRSSFKLLPTHLQALPILLRYDEVKLKRELINPDYEHLWLEFKELGLGTRTWPKFELRLGAALIKPNGFSQFPKIEIPLIDGKIKPFESWYAESQDDSGAKLELRFSLEKNIFDTTVWSKLDAADKALLIRLIYILPDTLRRLESEQVAIHRPWATWVNFAQASAQIIENTRRAAIVKAAPSVPEVKADVAPKSISKKVAPPKKVAPVPKAAQAKQVMPPTKAAPPKQVAPAAKVAPLKKVAPAAKAVPLKKVAPAPQAALPKKLAPAAKATAPKPVVPAAKAAPSKKVAPAPKAAALPKKPAPTPKATPPKQVAPAALAPLKKLVQPSKVVLSQKVATPAKVVTSKKAAASQKATPVKKVQVASKAVTAKKPAAPAPKAIAKKAAAPSKAGKK